MAGNMLLKMGQSAVEKKYGGKSQKTGNFTRSKPKKVDSFQYWGPRVEMRKDGQLFVNETKVGRHRKDTAYYESLGIPHEDANVLSKVKASARWLDGGITIPIIRLKIGASALIDLVPVGGDVVSGMLAMAIVTESTRVKGGLDGNCRAKMVKNVILDVLIGVTPVIGDLADVFFRCSTKNANLLEEMLLKRVKHNAKAARDAEKMGHAITQGHADSSGRYNTQVKPDTPPKYEDQPGGLRQRMPTQAAQYPVKKTQTSGREKGWLGGLKARAQDVGAMDEVTPVRIPRPQNSRPHNDGQF